MKFEGMDTTAENPKIPCSLPPEEVLERFTNELKHPINSIKGYTVILQNSTYQDQHQGAITNIERIAQRMEELCTIVSDYLQECLDR